MCDFKTLTQVDEQTVVRLDRFARFARFARLTHTLTLNEAAREDVTDLSRVSNSPPSKAKPLPEPGSETKECSTITTRGPEDLWDRSYRFACSKMRWT